MRPLFERLYFCGNGGAKRETLGALRTRQIEHFLFGERIHTEIMGLDSHSADFEG